MSKVLGIDLGTSISKMATILQGEPKCIESREGSVLIPSVVALTKGGERLVGILASRQRITNPKNTIFAVKRFIGRRFSDPEVQKELKRLSYETRERSDGGVEIKMGDPSTGSGQDPSTGSGQVPSTGSGQVKWYTPIEISSMILQKLKADAEEKLGEKITDVVITCPANFDDSQRKATKTAGEIAGFKVLRIINEPTAAALAYGFGMKKWQKVAVYDFGGGTFDITIFNIGPQEETDEKTKEKKTIQTVEVLSTGGEPHLGGEDFDQRIMNWIISEFKKEQGVDLSKDPLALQRVKEAAEKAKIELSSTTETEINLPFISADTAGPKHLYYKINRAQLENLTRDFIEKSIERTKKTIEESKLSKNEIDEVILVGGTTLIPAVREAVKNFFGKEPDRSINPEEVVAIGAAIDAEIIKAGKTGTLLLLDVLPLSMGIETLGGINTPMIAKNTTVPAAKTQIFSTAADSQTSVEINVLQGERSMATDNRSLGRFILDGIPPAPRGLPQIEVVFDVDANGIVTVTAKDKATGKSQSIRIEGSIGLSKEEIEKMKKEAEIHAAQDQKKKELIEAKNMADNLIYTSEKTLRESGDKISADLKKEVEEKINDLKKVKELDNIDEIKQKTSELSQTIQKVGAEIYRQSSGKKPEEGPQTEEGEYKEKK